MALIPHKADPNYEQQMKKYRENNSDWGGDDMNRGMPKPEAKQTPVTEAVRQTLGLKK